MTSIDADARETSKHRVARPVSEVFAPVVVIPMCTFIVSIHGASSWPSGLALGAVAVFFAVALPYGVLLAWVRSGRVDDREVRVRAQRPAILAITLASVATGLGLLWWLDAPRDLFALMAAMVAGMACTLAISTFWKISMHTSCLAGAITSLAILVTPWAAGLATTLPPIAWSRMLLKHHTKSQVVAGAALGILVAGIALSHAN